MYEDISTNEKKSIHENDFQKAIIDELSGTVIIKENYKIWSTKVYLNTGIEWGDTYGDVTGKMLFDSEDKLHNSRSYKQEFECWSLTLLRHLNKITGEFVIKLYIKGNPSKQYFGGNNYKNVSLRELRAILNKFSQQFCVDLKDIKLAAPTEASVTVELESDKFIIDEQTLRGRILSGKKDKYSQDHYVITKNSSGDFMGYEFKHGHLTNKVYLPSAKFRNSMNSLRIEVRFDKIQSLLERSGYPVTTWADLIKQGSHYKLCMIVLESWNNTIVIDPTLRRNRKYPDYLNKMIKDGKAAEFWWNEFPKMASDKTLKNWMNEYRELSHLKGEGLHKKIKLAIENIGELLRNPSNDEETEVEMNNKENKDHLSKKGIQRLKRELRNKEKERFMNELKKTLQMSIG